MNVMVNGTLSISIRLQNDDDHNLHMLPLSPATSHSATTMTMSGTRLSPSHSSTMMMMMSPTIMSPTVTSPSSTSHVPHSSAGYTTTTSSSWSRQSPSSSSSSAAAAAAAAKEEASMLSRDGRMMAQMSSSHG